jgi:hypothetical protein
MAHTPGPWTIEYETEEGEPYDDGVRIDSLEGPVAFNVIDCSAHLIAAAPDLLAACVAIAKDIRRLQFTDGEVRLSERSLGLMLELLEREIDKAMEGTNGKERSLD